MKRKDSTQTVTLTSPAAAGTSAGATTFKGALFQRSDRLVIDAAIRGGTGGTLDVYLQRKVATDTWNDLVHWPQQAAGGAIKRYTCTINGDGTSILEVTGGTDAVPAPSLAVNTNVNCMPGDEVRVVFVAGVGTSAGASQSITITSYVDRH